MKEINPNKEGNKMRIATQLEIKESEIKEAKAKAIEALKEHAEKDGLKIIGPIETMIYDHAPRLVMEHLGDVDPILAKLKDIRAEYRTLEDDEKWNAFVNNNKEKLKDCKRIVRIFCDAVKVEEAG
jgi:hypothetical protein